MYNVLQNNFENTIAREGITISTYISNQEFQAFFRRLNDGLNQRDTMTMFYPVGSPVHSGSIITLNDKQFILLNQESIENKSAVIRCNGTISTADAKVMNLPFYGSGASSAFPSSGGVSTKYIAVISGQTEIITEDCELARKLAINDKFNAWGRTWKIENIFYVDGIVTLNIEVQADEEITYTYDERNHCIEEHLMNTDGRLAVHASEAYSWLSREVDADGRILGVRYFDIKVYGSSVSSIA